MSYIETERTKAVKNRNTIFCDPGGGDFMKATRDFVLQDPVKNLWCGIREDALDYFNQNNISWWKSDKEGPTGHLLSSQVACINHLFFIRQRKDCADAMLRAIHPDIVSAEVVDNGYVEFEKCGSKPLGLEKGTQRGANSTSIDAFMLARMKDGTKTAVLIEWKYTESYNSIDLMNSSAGTPRLPIYKDLLTRRDSPISTKTHSDLFYKPYYQLMRQTLLGFEMVNNREYGVSDWMHLHIIPSGNTALLNKVTSPALKKSYATLEDSWKAQLKEPKKYQIISPDHFLKPALDLVDTKSINTFLKSRYW
ncbi:MAG: hypothetical protein JEZ03_05570 [Bacteroidales bacterium]|nr:hypothetical protein [Bacteroidales bacterium]